MLSCTKRSTSNLSAATREKGEILYMSHCRRKSIADKAKRPGAAKVLSSCALLMAKFVLPFVLLEIVVELALVYVEEVK